MPQSPVADIGAGEDRHPRWQRWAAITFLTTIAVQWAVNMVVPVPADMQQPLLGSIVIGSLMQLTLPIVAFVVAWRQPTNRLGWVLLVGAFSASTGLTFTDAIASRYRPAWAAWIVYPGDALFYVGISLLAGYFLLLFPTGRPPSPRWRVPMWSGAVGIVGVAVWSFVRPCATFALVDQPVALPACGAPLPAGMLRFANPLGIGFPGGDALWGVIGGVSAALVFLLLFLGAVSVFVRYRQGSVAERLQLRWPGAVLVLAIPAFLVIAILDVVFGWDSDGASFAIFVALLVGLPISIGIAITRYRLFEIDRIISRSVTFAAVVVILGGAYAFMAVLPLSLLIGRGAGSTPSWLVASSTLATAALFSPVRRRVQRVVDRRFNRSHYDAEQVAAGFAERLRDATDVKAVEEDLTSVVARILGPSSIGVWARSEVS